MGRPQRDGVGQGRAHGGYAIIVQRRDRHARGFLKSNVSCKLYEELKRVMLIYLPMFVVSSDAVLAIHQDSTFRLTTAIGRSGRQQPLNK